MGLANRQAADQLSAVDCCASARPESFAESARSRFDEDGARARARGPRDEARDDLETVDAIEC
jgi:hypothetical protein